MDEGAHALRSCLLLIVALMGARLEVAGVLMTDCIYSRPVKQISSEDDKVISHRQRCTELAQWMLGGAASMQRLLLEGAMDRLLCAIELPVPMPSAQC